MWTIWRCVGAATGIEWWILKKLSKDREQWHEVLKMSYMRQWMQELLLSEAFSCRRRSIHNTTNNNIASWKRNTLNSASNWPTLLLRARKLLCTSTWPLRNIYTRWNCSGGMESTYTVVSIMSIPSLRYSSTLLPSRWKWQINRLKPMKDIRQLRRLNGLRIRNHKLVKARRSQESQMLKRKRCRSRTSRRSKRQTNSNITNKLVQAPHHQSETQQHSKPWSKITQIQFPLLKPHRKRSPNRQQSAKQTKSNLLQNKLMRPPMLLRLLKQRILPSTWAFWLEKQQVYKFQRPQTRRGEPKQPRFSQHLWKW